MSKHCYRGFSNPRATRISAEPGTKSANSTKAMGAISCEITPSPMIDTKLRSDLKTLALFVELYCRHKHDGKPRKQMKWDAFDLECVAERKIELCPECTRLLAHALVKRSHCPMNPKPACKHCPSQCYHPRYQAAIREVMRYSGRKMLMGGRLDYLFHLLF